MTRCLRDMTLFKVASGGFAFVLISRDSSSSRGIVPGTDAVTVLNRQELAPRENGGNRVALHNVSVTHSLSREDTFVISCALF